MKKYFKKGFALLLAALLCLTVFTACGKDKAPETPDKVKGETYETERISALVPDGWKAFPAADVFDEYDGDYDPTTLNIIKGGESEFDMFTKPYMQIKYYPDNTMYDTRDWYDNVVDLEPMQLGGYTWNAFTGSSLDYPIAVLWTEGDVQLQITVMLEVEDGKVSLDDMDVQAIIASVRVK